MNSWRFIQGRDGRCESTATEQTHLPCFMCWRTVKRYLGANPSNFTSSLVNVGHLWLQSWWRCYLPRCLKRWLRCHDIQTSPPSCREQWVISSGLLYLRCHWAVTGLEHLGNIWLTEKCDRVWLPSVLEKGETPVSLNRVEMEKEAGWQTVLRESTSISKVIVV